MANKKDIDLLDDILENALVSLRLSSGINRTVASELRELEKTVVNMLRVSGVSDFNKRELEQLLYSVRDSIKGKFSDVEKVILRESKDLAEITAEYTARSLNKAFEGSVDIKTPSSAVLSIDDTVQGATTSAWIAKQSNDTVFSVLSSVRADLEGVLSKRDIIANVKDRLEVSKRNAETFVNTYTQTVTGNARLETYRENSDVVKSVKWVTALDGVVCKMCIPRDVLEWTVDGEPIGGHSVSFMNPPIHFNDRCVLVPVTKTFKDLGLDIEELKTPRGETSFEEFLDRKGEAFQNDVLGKGRADLWRDGKITLRDLISGRGKPLTIQQIKDKM